MKLFYRILLKLLFNLIYGEVKNRKEKYNKKLRLITLKFYNKNYKLFEIEKGRIFTDCNTNVAYISQDNNLMNFSFQQNKNKLSSINYNSVLKYGTPKIKKKN